MAFNQHPAVAAVLPAMGDPDRAGMGRPDPMAMHPNVAMAIPAVIAVDPDPAVMRWMLVDFDDGRGRRHTNDNLRQ